MFASSATLLSGAALSMRSAPSEQKGHFIPRSISAKELSMNRFDNWVDESHKQRRPGFWLPYFLGGAAVVLGLFILATVQFSGL